MFDCGRSVSAVVGCEAERSHCDLHPALLFLLSHSPPPPFSFDFLYSSAILLSFPHPVMFVSPLFSFSFLSFFSFSSFPFFVSSQSSSLVSSHLFFLLFFPPLVPSSSCLFFSVSASSSSFPVFSFRFLPSLPLPFLSPPLLFSFSCLIFSFSCSSPLPFYFLHLPLPPLLLTFHFLNFPFFLFSSYPKSLPRLPLSSSFLPFFSSPSFTFLFLFSTLFSSFLSSSLSHFLSSSSFSSSPILYFSSPLPSLLKSSSFALPYPPLLPRNFHFHFFLLIFSTRRCLSLLKSSPCLLFSPPLCTNVPVFLSFLLPLPLSDLSLVAAEIRRLHVFPNLICGGKKILRRCWKQLHVIIFLGCTWIKNILFIGSGPERWRICDQSSLNWVTEDLSYFGLCLGKWFVLR